MRHAELPVSLRHLAAICFAAALALASPTRAQSTGGVFTLNPQSIAAGGGRATGGSFELEGTIGQHDASNAQSGGVFTLTGGFHRRAATAVGETIFRNGFEGP